MTVLIVGSVAFDDLDGPHGKRTDVLGGSATYASVAASFFSRVALVAVVGEDFPESAMSMLAGKGVDLVGLERVPGRTFRWSGRYSDDLASRTTLDTQLNVFESFRPALSDSHRATPYVMLGNIHPTLQRDVVSQCEGRRFVIADTMNFWIEGQNAALRETLRHIDALVINEEEARMLSGAHNIVRAAEAIRAMGPRIVAIKRGEYGAIVFEPDGVFVAPAYPVRDVVDPTGAGDTFAGGFLGYLAHASEVTPATLRHAVVVGTTLASFCVEDFGLDRLVRVTRSEIAARYRELARIVHFATEDEVARFA
ncbi:MAG: sugar kinase [Deltaproteobacteria bacterium]|nr:sugar kinase [Deltaproteobacteria bacterium]